MSSNASRRGLLPDDKSPTTSPALGPVAPKQKVHTRARSNSAAARYSLKRQDTPAPQARAELQSSVKSTLPKNTQDDRDSLSLVNILPKTFPAMPHSPTDLAGDDAQAERGLQLPSQQFLPVDKSRAARPPMDDPDRPPMVPTTPTPDSEIDEAEDAEVLDDKDDRQQAAAARAAVRTRPRSASAGPDSASTLARTRPRSASAPTTPTNTVIQRRAPIPLQTSIRKILGEELITPAIAEQRIEMWKRNRRGRRWKRRRRPRVRRGIMHFSDQINFDSFRLGEQVEVNTVNDGWKRGILTKLHPEHTFNVICYDKSTCTKWRLENVRHIANLQPLYEDEVIQRPNKRPRTDRMPGSTEASPNHPTGIESVDEILHDILSLTDSISVGMEVTATKDSSKGFFHVGDIGDVVAMRGTRATVMWRKQGKMSWVNPWYDYLKSTVQRPYPAAVTPTDSPMTEVVPDDKIRQESRSEVIDSDSDGDEASTVSDEISSVPRSDDPEALESAESPRSISDTMTPEITGAFEETSPPVSGRQGCCVIL